MTIADLVAKSASTTVLDGRGSNACTRWPTGPTRASTALRRVVHRPTPSRWPTSGRPGDGPAHDRGRPAARRRRRHRPHQRGSRGEFGAEIATLVDGVTKLTRIPYQSKEDAQVGELRKMFLAMARDIRVIIIKLADRLHNMRTLASLRPPNSRRSRRKRSRSTPRSRTGSESGGSNGTSKIWRSVSRSRRLSRYRRARGQEAQRARGRGRTSDRRPEKVEFGKVRSKPTRRPPQALLLDPSQDAQGRDFSTIYDLTAIR